MVRTGLNRQSSISQGKAQTKSESRGTPGVPGPPGKRWRQQNNVIVKRYFGNNQ